MKRVFFAALLLLLCVVQSYASSVNQVTGLAASGPPALNIPLAFSINCNNSNCPNTVSPSYTDEDRVWGATAVCRTSIDRGSTWANCAGAVPVTFTSTIMVAEASDGSVIVLGRPSGDSPASCTVYRSTDVGLTWSLVHSGPNACSFVGGEADGQHLWCTSTGNCTAIFRNGGTSVGTIYTSTNNGLTWSTTVTAVINSVQTSTLDLATGNNGGGYGITSVSPQLRLVGGAWSTVTQATGYDCWGSWIFGSQPYALCQNGTQYVALDGVTGSIDRVITFPDTLIFSLTGSQIVNLSGDILYAMTPTLSTATNNFMVSLDNGASWVTLFTATSISRRGGGAFVHPVNGCVYFFRTLSRVVGICQ